MVKYDPDFLQHVDELSWANQSKSLSLANNVMDFQNYDESHCVMLARNHICGGIQGARAGKRRATNMYQRGKHGATRHVTVTGWRDKRGETINCTIISKLSNPCLALQG